MRRIGSLLVGGAALFIVGCPVDDADEVAPPPVEEPAEPPTDPAELDTAGEQAIARDLFDRLNDERQARDLDPLEWDEQLADLAAEWSDEMAGTGRLEHRDIDADLIEDLDGFVGVGENIFGATGPVPAGQAHVGWMESPGHRANLLGPGWDRVGIGVTCTEDGEMYATQNFGSTDRDAEPPDPAEPPPEEPVARGEIDGPTC